jgi:hypothetical protein
MKIIARYLSAAAALGVVLVFAGCTTQTAKGPRVESVAEFTVVESSTDKELTPAQLAELRQAVINYLHRQGLEGSRLYFVKVTFPPANPDDEPQWAVVRIGNLPAQTYTLLAAYPGRDDYQPYDYYRYGYYNPAYAGFSRWGYYDPFDYNYGGYARPMPPRDHGKPHQPDGKPDHPPGTRTRWNNTPRTNPEQPITNAHPPRTANPERWARERADNRGGYTRGDSGDSSSGGRTYSPRPERSYTPPTSNTDISPPRMESSNAGIQSGTSVEKEK